MFRVWHVCITVHTARNLHDTHAHCTHAKPRSLTRVCGHRPLLHACGVHPHVHSCTHVCTTTTKAGVPTCREKHNARCTQHTVHGESACCTCTVSASHATVLVLYQRHPLFRMVLRISRPVGSAKPAARQSAAVWPSAHPPTYKTTESPDAPGARTHTHDTHVQI